MIQSKNANATHPCSQDYQKEAQIKDRERHQMQWLKSDVTNLSKYYGTNKFGTGVICMGVV